MMFISTESKLDEIVGCCFLVLLLALLSVDRMMKSMPIYLFPLDRLLFKILEYAYKDYKLIYLLYIPPNS